MRKKYLEKKNKDLEDKLYSAVDNNDTKASLALIKKVVNFNRVKNFIGYTLLHVATMKNNTKVSLALIAAGIDVNAVTNDKITPLLFAVAHENEIVSLALLAAGANAESSSLLNFSHIDNIHCHVEAKERLEEILAANPNHENIDALNLILQNIDLEMTEQQSTNRSFVELFERLSKTPIASQGGRSRKLNSSVSSQNKKRSPFNIATKR